MSGAEAIEQHAIGEPTPVGRSAWSVSPTTAIAVFVAALALFSLVGLATNSEPLVQPSDGETAPSAGSVSGRYGATAQDAPPVEDVIVEPPKTPPRLPGIIAIAAAILVVAALLVVLRSWLTGNAMRWRLGRFTDGRFEEPTEPDAEEVARLAADLREQLLHGDDPRLAIQQAYAAVESGFGVEQFTRDPAETPLRYLARVFGRLGAVQEPLGRLTTLFELARFSTRPITEAMRDEAAAALADIRSIYLDAAKEADGAARQDEVDECSS